jgi:hypothetical protein
MDFYLVDVKSIKSNIPRSQFSETDLENLADMILESGGIIRPLILKPAGIDAYTIIDGDFEYYGAVRAREKNPRKGEMVNAFVIPPKLEKLVAKQVAIFRNTKTQVETDKPEDKTTGNSPKTVNEKIVSIDSSVDSSRLTNIELRFEKQFNELRSEFAKERERIDEKFKEFQQRIPERSDPLKLLNTLLENELVIKLQRSRIPGADKLAKGIFEARKKKPDKLFKDYRDVKESVKGLGDKTVLTIIDEWSR